VAKVKIIELVNNILCVQLGQPTGKRGAGHQSVLLHASWVLIL